MKVSRSLAEFSADKPVILTQGTFDGVHLGHQKILKTIIAEAKAIDGDSVLLTFFPHPRLVLFPDDNDLKLITTLTERLRILESMGLDQVVVLPFTKEISRIRSEEYVRNVLVNHLKVNTFVIGYDHRFGRNREGSIEDLERMSELYEFGLQEIPRQDLEESAISSSKIRRALECGDVSTAARFLGRNFDIVGTVVHGRKKGSELGYPTANLKIEEEYKLVPANGVYAVKVEYNNQQYGGMLNIGDNPTFEEARWSIEVNIFEFNEEIYGQQLRISFVERMRNEVKFVEIKGLKKQLDVDKAMALSILKQ